MFFECVVTTLSSSVSQGIHTKTKLTELKLKDGSEI